MMTEKQILAAFEKLWELHKDWVGSGFRYDRPELTAQGMLKGYDSFKGLLRTSLHRYAREILEKVERSVLENMALDMNDKLVVLEYLASEIDKLNEK